MRREKSCEIDIRGKGLGLTTSIGRGVGVDCLRVVRQKDVPCIVRVETLSIVLIALNILITAIS